MAQNTISDELNRLIQAKADIKTALESKGVTIGDSSTLDEFPALIEDMPSGGGGIDTSVLIELIEGDITSFEIPNGTTKIRLYAFNSYSSLVDVTIPSTVTSIGKWAFSSCNLSNLNTLPSSVTVIPDYCFNSTGLMKFIIPNTVTYIGNFSFTHCSNLATVIIPASVTNMGSNCFLSCSNLNDIVLLHNSKVPSTLGSNSLHGNTMGPIYVLNSMLSSFLNNNSFNQYLKSRFTPLAFATFESSTNTVQASGRDTLELYIDSSLINSSVYTFTPGAADTSHNIMVKSVDPSLGVLDTYNLEVLVEGLSIPSTTPVIVLDPEVSQEEVDILDENDEPTGKTETQETQTGMYRVIATANSDTQYVSITVNGVDASNPTDYVYEAADGWDTPDSSLDATLVVTATCQEPGKTPTTVTEYYIEAESGGGDSGETYDYTMTPEFNSELNCYEFSLSIIEADGYGLGGCFPDSWVLNGNTGSNSSDYAIHASIDFYPPWNQNGGNDAGVINSVTITLYEATPGHLSLNLDSSLTKGTLTQDPNNSLVYTYTITDDQGLQLFAITNYVNGNKAEMKIAKIEYTYTPYEV